MSSTSPPKNSRLVESPENAMSDLIFSKRGCCFWVPFLQPNRCSASDDSRSVWWGRIRKPDSEERWWKKGWRKVREWSEFVAGPKWKTFLRRFGKKAGSAGSAGSRTGKFRYDPLSYAKNFDEGNGREGDGDDGDGLYRGFSTRYAVLPASAKSSMDLGRNGLDFISAQPVAAA